MSNEDLIATLIDTAEVEGPGTMGCLLKEAAEAIENLEERVAIMSADHDMQWISVKDRLPDDSLLNKLVVDSEGQIRICGKVATFKKGNGETVFIPDSPIIDSLLLGAKSYEDVWKITHITHWMPLPELPN